MRSKYRMYDPPHPGGVLKRVEMEPRKLTVSEFAKVLRMSRVQLSQVVNGHARITPDLAVRLSRALKTSPDLWLGMQAEYDLWQAEHTAPHKEIKPLPDFEESVAG